MLWKLRLGPVFGRREVRETGSAFLDGLLSGIARKTGWMMAEQAGLPRPWRMQALLGRSRWDAEALRDEVRAYALEALGCPDGVLVVDETGFVKKGRHSVGVARQYSGTAGRVENSQVGVFLAYAGRLGLPTSSSGLYGDDNTKPQRLSLTTKNDCKRNCSTRAYPFWTEPYPTFRM